MSRDLSKMSLEELWQLFPIQLTEYRSCWAAWYAEEASAVRAILGGFANPVIHHIGSTAIPGIWAKPIIDILVMLPDQEVLEAAAERLAGNGYIRMSSTENRISLNKGYTTNGFAERVFHTHLRLPGDDDELHFRDYLCTHPKEAAEYEKLKLSLWHEHEHDRDGYTDGKTAFVMEHTARARNTVQGAR